MDTSIIDDWIDLYEAAWRAASTDQLKDIFTDDVTYKTTPFIPAIEGLDELSRLWESRSDPDEAFDMDHEIVALEGDVAVVRVHVVYHDPKQEWRCIWIVQLNDDGQCFSFEEWPIKPDQDEA